MVFTDQAIDIYIYNIFVPSRVQVSLHVEYL